MSSSEIPRRPNPGEDEDDLLREMQQFDPSKSSVSKQNIVSFQPKKKSKFAEQRAKIKESQKQNEDVSPQVLSNIVKEREVNHDQFVIMTGNIIPSNDPFPNVARIEKQKFQDSAAKSSKSLFAQQLEEAGTSKASSVTCPQGSLVAETRNRDWGDASRILKTSLSTKDKQDIHEANVAILDSKSDEELKKDRDELLEKLDPALVEFLMRRKAAKRPPEEPMTQDDGDQTQQPSMPKKILSQDVIGRFPNMNKYEHDKMEWMEDVEPDDKVTDKPQVFSARFNFKGELLPYDADDIMPNEGLHHHGEEPQRPGYTLEELVTLARSSNAQQAVIAIQTLGNVIKNERHGRFVGCFGNENLLVKLLDADLVTVLRVSMDNHYSEALIDSAIQALAEIFYHELEENALDYQFFHSTFNGYMQPNFAAKLSSDKDFKDEASELKDIEVMNADLVLGILRTGIIERICYLFESKKLVSSSGITNILKILIRIARHSLSVTYELVKHERLLKTIGKHYVNFFFVIKSFI